MSKVHKIHQLFDQLTSNFADAMVQLVRPCIRLGVRFPPLNRYWEFQYLPIRNIYEFHGFSAMTIWTSVTGHGNI